MKSLGLIYLKLEKKENQLDLGPNSAGEPTCPSTVQQTQVRHSRWWRSWGFQDFVWPDGDGKGWQKPSKQRKCWKVENLVSPLVIDKIYSITLLTYLFSLPFCYEHFQTHGNSWKNQILTTSILWWTLLYSLLSHVKLSINSSHVSNKPSYSARIWKSLTVYFPLEHLNVHLLIGI